MNAYHQTPAIVLAMRDEREADRLVIFYTRDFGKINAFARGIRFMKSKLRGHLVPGALVRIAFIEGREVLHLVDAELLYNPFYPPYVIHFLDRVTTERQPDEALWQFLADRLLDSRVRGNDIITFQSRVLSILGFLPPDAHASEQQIHAALAANHLEL